MKNSGTYGFVTEARLLGFTIGLGIHVGDDKARDNACGRTKIAIKPSTSLKSGRDNSCAFRF